MEEKKPSSEKSQDPSADFDQAKVPESAKTGVKKIPLPYQQYRALSAEEKQKFVDLRNTAHKYHRQKRIVDALEQAYQMGEMIPEHPEVLLLLGICYVEMRNFEKATRNFQKALQYAPHSINIEFNLAELKFVTKKWKEAISAFTKLVEKLPKNVKAYKRILYLSEFKILLCMLKTNQEDEARKLSEKYNKYEDTPYYFYAQAAMHYYDNNYAMGDRFLVRANYIWHDKNTLYPWKDTLIEFGYLQSFYGGNLDQELKEKQELE